MRRRRVKCSGGRIGEQYIIRVVPHPLRKKQCSICLDWLETEHFSRDRQNPDGRRNECCFCRHEYRTRKMTAAELREELAREVE